VACKDWLTNKVDRCVTGKVATQQTCGAIQLPLNNVSVMALDFVSNKGVATSLGHAPAAALIDPAAGSKLAIAEALTNLVWAPLTYGLKGVSLSANWMWPAKNEGENARLYEAVEAVSDFACNLGINIPTGKDSLSMVQKYPDGSTVLSPGTVIISAVGEVDDIRKTVSPDLKNISGSKIIYIDFSKDEFKLGGSSFAQVVNCLGESAPTIRDAEYFKKAFEAVQQLTKQDLVLAGHDISSGGLITTLLEMCFPTPDVGLSVDLKDFKGDLIENLFSENPGVIIQVENSQVVLEALHQYGVDYKIVGEITDKRNLSIANGPTLSIDKLREKWFLTSYQFDKIQRPKGHAEKKTGEYFQPKIRIQISTEV